jgi:AcrR family transcriptional regulator
MLDCLEEIFQKEGFRKTTIAELASRLRCSRRSLYQLARSKDELFLVALDRLLRRIRQLGEEALAEEPDPGERLAAYLRPGFTETFHASSAFFADIESFPRARRMLEEHQVARAGGVRRIIEDGVRRGQLRRVNPSLVSEVARVVAAFREWSELLLHGVLNPTGIERKGRR